MLTPAEPQQVIDGWKHAVPTMRRGEVATVTMQSEYAYSTSGTGSGIPPNAPLTIVIELWDTCAPGGPVQVASDWSYDLRKVISLDQAHVDGNFVTAPAWPAHPRWLAAFLEVLG